MSVKLSTLKPGARGVVCKFTERDSGPSLTGRLMEMGLTIGAELEVAHEAPFGGALAVRCRGSLVALRLGDAELVEVTLT